jgi:fructoselysine-6-P-deglycase FrlB-like protein
VDVELPGPEEPSPPYGRTGHPYFLHEMITAQPSAVRATIRAAGSEGRAILSPPSTGPLLLTGLGTSFHAALAVAGVARASSPPLPWPVVALDAFDLLDSPSSWAGAAGALVFSSSGETALTVAAQRSLRDAGVPQVLVSGTSRSRSSSLADHHLRTQEAEERAWVHTVSYTTAIAAAVTLLAGWAGRPAPDAEVAATALAALVAREAEWKRRAEEIRDRRTLLLLGSGVDGPTAREAALKLREGAGRFAAAVGVEEFLHGVLPSIDERVAVLAVADSELEGRRARIALAAAARAGAKTALFTRSSPASGGGEHELPLVPRPLAPVVDIVPFQFLVYWLAVGERRNPDVMGYDDPRIFAARRMYGI